MSSSNPFSPAGQITPAEPKPGPQGGQPPLSPGLHIVATPIGHLRDITLRAIDTLTGADEILAEDTRLARRLLDAHNIKTKMTPYHDHNGASRRPELIEKLAAGATIALISDAGTPLVSDPGYKLVREAIAAGVKIVPVPGASALLAGLVISGLPSDQFLFAGFPPPKSTARTGFLSRFTETPASLIFYESPRRLAACLTDMVTVFGANRPGVVARELTKLFEEARRGTLQSLAAHYSEAGAPKGEVVVLVGPPETRPDVSAATLDAALKEALQHMPLKAAAAEVSKALQMPKREVYQRGLKLKNEA